ncbi:stemmadenine O-acetyltransferase [Manihot esculenta]|uniref:stemmadenine O-acetyltransferase n=1 Tax=Manihot esculenta TaxID=3983 RepID=UPI000B5D5B87|nr:stemmadenine O-acetyltransferase [Manihot esculenta]
MEVQIISKEIVKPSSSTHPRTYNLSLLDQLAPQLYVPMIFFYSSTGEKNSQKTKSHRLKTSLSKTLTHYYPFAGRIKDAFSIDCNDKGASFIEANVAGKMSVILDEPDIDKLEKLLPCNPYDVSPERSSQVILAAQVNHFDCGGMAVSVCFWHIITDISAASSFLTSWAAIARGSGDDIEGVIFDCTSLFPPLDLQGFSYCESRKEDLSNIMVKRFVFDSSKLAALREEIASRPCLDPPTRFEAIAALIWRAVIAEIEEKNKNNGTSIASMPVGMRKRMNPQLPKLAIGNMYEVALAYFSKNDEELPDYNGLARKLHESIGNVNNDYVKKIHSDGEYMQRLSKIGREFGENPTFAFSSWCKQPLYEVDFGWGKPSWVVTPLKLYKVAIFIDTKDGEGVEAWVSLPKEDMVKFEQNPGIRAYSSFKPSTK